jgi:hypothetical protein
MLCPKMTFESCCIDDGASIVALREEYLKDPARKAFVESWVLLTQDAETFNERINFTLNPAARMEVARLRDLRHIRMERRSKYFSRLTQSVMNLEAAARIKVVGSLNLNYEVLDAPNCKALPVLWQCEERSVYQLLDHEMKPAVSDQAAKVGIPAE